MFMMCIWLCMFLYTHACVCVCVCVCECVCMLCPVSKLDTDQCGLLVTCRLEMGRNLT